MRLKDSPTPVQTGSQQDVSVVWLGIDALQDYNPERHRFKPASEHRIKELEESIRINGILNPLLVRKLPSGTWQILGGHNRRTAARNIGYTRVPCIVKELPLDDDAQLAVNADNMHNRELLPSERGWIYRDELEIRGRRQGQRTDLTSGQNVPKLNRSRDTLDENLSGRNVARYIRLTYLIPAMLDLVDQGKIGLGTGEQLSYLSKRSQEVIHTFCYGSEPSHPLKEPQAKVLREVEADPDRIIDEDLLFELTAKKQTTRLRTVKLDMAELRPYFPAGTSEQVVKYTIHTALAMYFDKKDSAFFPQNNS